MNKLYNIKEYLIFSDWLCSIPCGLSISCIFTIIMGIVFNGPKCYFSIFHLMNQQLWLIIILTLIISFASLSGSLLYYLELKGVNINQITDKIIKIISCFISLIAIIVTIFFIIDSINHNEGIISIIIDVIKLIIFILFIFGLLGYFLTIINAIFGGICYLFIKFNRKCIQNIIIRLLWSIFISILLFLLMIYILVINCPIEWYWIGASFLILVILKLSDVITLSHQK